MIVFPTFPIRMLKRLTNYVKQKGLEASMMQTLFSPTKNGYVDRNFSDRQTAKVG